MTSSYDSAPVQRALAIMAHPDDVDFGSAGAVASWTSADIDVTYCVCTSGDAGEAPGTPRDQVADQRRREQRAAAAAVGVNDVRFLDYADGQVVADLGLRRALSRVIRQVRPQRLLTHSPEINWDAIAISHPDHRAVGEAALAAVYPDARNEWAFPELLSEDELAPWSVDEVWMSEAPRDRINHAVDITDLFPAKLRALHAHESQTAHLTGLEEHLRTRLGATAARHGLPPGHLAEGFQVVRI